MDSERKRPGDENGVPLRAGQIGRHRLTSAGRIARILAFAFGGTLILQGCDGTTYPPYRYKETVVVETPQGIRTGSTVIEVRMYKEGQSNPFARGAIHGQFKGEAAEVDLPNGRALFALLTSPSNYGWAKGAYQMLAQLTPEEMAQPYDPDNTGFDIQYRRAMALKGPQILPRMMPSAAPSHEPVSAYPWLVTFGNMTDPTSVRAVDPDNLAASFGHGYKLRAIVLEKTDEPVGARIQKALVWLNDYRARNSRLDGDTSVAIKSNDLKSNLSSGDFWVESY